MRNDAGYLKERGHRFLLVLRCLSKVIIYFIFHFGCQFYMRASFKDELQRKSHYECQIFLSLDSTAQ
jgi:hypothetical protein